MAPHLLLLLPDSRPSPCLSSHSGGRSDVNSQHSQPCCWRDTHRAVSNRSPTPSSERLLKTFNVPPIAPRRFTAAGDPSRSAGWLLQAARARKLMFFSFFFGSGPLWERYANQTAYLSKSVSLTLLLFYCSRRSLFGFRGRFSTKCSFGVFLC